MASLAESSIASVPLHDLEVLQQQLLRTQPPKTLPAGWDRDATIPAQHRGREQPGANAGGDMHANPRVAYQDKQQEVNSADNGQLIAVIPDSVNVYSAKTSLAANQPSLLTTHSVPEMEAIMQPTPSQEALRATTRAEPFHGYPGGDTQPIESQVYRDYTESMANPAATTPKKTVLSVKVSPDGRGKIYDTVVTERTPQTCGEGETGFIDLAGAWQPPSPIARSASDIEELLVSSQTPTYVSDGVPARIDTPATPAVAGHKRNRSGEILTSRANTTTKTPGFSQLFAGVTTVAVMSNTQMFYQTQAPSSPVPNAPRSDPVVSRPSPNIDHNVALTMSSPTAMMSSPVATSNGRPCSAMGEPRARYTSMRESQEKRAAALRQELGLPAVDENSDEEESQRIRYQQMRLQRLRSDQTMSEIAKLRVPSQLGLQPMSSRKRPALIDLITPARPAYESRVEFEISDDEDTNDEDVRVVEDEREIDSVNGQDEDVPVLEEDGGQASVDEMNEDDVYDELAQTVLRSQPDDLGDLNEDEVRSQVEGGTRLDAPEENAHAQDGQDCGPGDDELPDTCPSTTEIRHSRQLQHLGDVMGASQRTAVADSQPTFENYVHNILKNATKGQSSMASFVPGSQYAGKTSQEQAQLRGVLTGRLPSSPPPLGESSAKSKGSTELPHTHKEEVAPFLDLARSIAGESPRLQEIPESDILDCDGLLPATVEPAVSNPKHKSTESNSIPAPFSTAQTHLSISEPSLAENKSNLSRSPFKALASQHSRVSIESPRRIAGVRRFADIAADPSPPGGSCESEIDVDTIMSDVMTAEDKAFLEAMSSPVNEKINKRRKLMKKASGTSKSAILSPEKVTNATPIQADPAAAKQSQPEPTQPPMVEQHAEKPSTVLQNSPSKANELPISTPADAEPPDGTQESAKKREEAGARAVSQLLSARAMKPKGFGKLKGVQMHTVPHAAQMTGSKKSLRLNCNPKKLKKMPATSMNDGTVSGMRDTREVSNAVPEVAARPADAVQADADLPIAAPTRILALFKGNYNSFYPATWLSTSGDGKRYRVNFDDDTVTEIEAQHVRALDLRVGDAVKVDGVGMRMKTWVIVGFGEALPVNEQHKVGTDLFGRAVVKVRMKTSRNSLPASDAKLQTEAEIADMRISSIYVTHTMWPAFAKRVFHPPETAKCSTSRLATPSTANASPNVETPASRSRRKSVPTSKVAAGRSSHLRDESSLSHLGTGLFSGMAFAISYGSNEAEKAEVTLNIQRNGGMILDSGFDELFELPDLDITSVSSRSKGSPSKGAITPPSARSLRLKTEFANLGFVALIADRHCRRAKYMQALALGLPTLSARWITDSLVTVNGDTDGTPLAWSKYLLPSGESAYLNGAVRSRTISIYHPAQAKLADIIAQRELLLNGDGVLLVASAKKGKATWERRKAYAFLTLALGAGKVKRVNDLQEAKICTDQDKSEWKWIYVDGAVADVQNVLCAGGAKKRKRDQDAGKIDRRAAFVSDGNVKVVNDEFVVQSLILGALVE